MHYLSEAIYDYPDVVLQNLGFKAKYKDSCVSCVQSHHWICHLISERVYHVNIGIFLLFSCKNSQTRIISLWYDKKLSATQCTFRFSKGMGFDQRENCEFCAEMRCIKWGEPMSDMEQTETRKSPPANHCLFLNKNLDLFWSILWCFFLRSKSSNMLNTKLPPPNMILDFWVC